MTSGSGQGGWAPVYRVVRRIPAGRVATYGAVARLAGMPGAARQVGWALHAVDAGDDLPWHRVINARGEVSRRGAKEVEDLQRARLEAEGVVFDGRGRVDLERFGWRPRGSRSGSGGGRQRSTGGRKRSTGTRAAPGATRDSGGGR